MQKRTQKLIFEGLIILVGIVILIDWTSEAIQDYKESGQIKSVLDEVFLIIAVIVLALFLNKKKKKV